MNNENFPGLVGIYLQAFVWIPFPSHRCPLCRRALPSSAGPPPGRAGSCRRRSPWRRRRPRTARRPRHPSPRVNRRGAPFESTCDGNVVSCVKICRVGRPICCKMLLSFSMRVASPAWAVGSYSNSQSAGGTSQNIYLQNLATDRTPRSVCMKCLKVHNASSQNHPKIAPKNRPRVKWKRIPMPL